MGALAGPIGIAVAAIVAAIGIYAKFHESVDRSLGDLTKQVDANEKSAKSTAALVTEFDQYKTKVGALPGDLAALDAAQEKLLKAQKDLLALQLPAQLDLLKKKLDELQAPMSFWADVMDKARLAMEALVHSGKDVLEMLTGFEKFSAKNILGVMFDEGARAAGQYTEKQRQAAVVIAETKAKIAENVVEQDNLKKGMIQTGEEAIKAALDQKTAADQAAQAQKDAAEKAQATVAQAIAAAQAKEAEYAATAKVASDDLWGAKIAKVREWQEAQQAALHKVEQQEITNAQQQGASAAQVAAIQAQYTQAGIALDTAAKAKMEQTLRGFFGINQTVYGQIEQFADQAFQKIATGMGNAMAKMIVEGKSFAQTMKSVWQDLEEQVISMITQMMIKWAAFEAMTAAFGGFGGGTALGGLKGLPGFATGVDTLVDTPTPFMAGESGPERVTVTPLYGGGAAGGGGGGGAAPANISLSVSVQAGQTSDPNELANVIGQKVLQAIRGQGQLQFVRTS